MADWLEEYKANLKVAESKLHDCERLLRENGVECPVSQPRVAKKEKIWLPAGYIRTAKYFRDAYQLPPSIGDLSTRNNIAFALQYSDFLSYIDNRFYLGDYTIKDVFYRSATAHVMSIFESILFGLVETAHRHCMTDDSPCKKSKKCEWYMRSPKKYGFTGSIEMVVEKGIYAFDDDTKQVIIKLKEIRDRVHMWDAGSSDFHDEKFSVKNYNEAMAMLHLMRDEVIDAFRTYHGRQVFGCPKNAIPEGEH